METVETYTRAHTHTHTLCNMFVPHSPAKRSTTGHFEAQRVAAFNAWAWE